MPKLTRYSSFEKLKADSMAASQKTVDPAKDLKDFEHFLAYLRQSSTLKKNTAKQSEAANE
ncbi:MAG: hypothetical protein LH478_07750 [Chitinophagaceae bacterium]|nr:hypothetical protein [Chitinophagaceae bacterium]